MHPKLLDIPLGPLGSLPVNSYGFMVMLGFLAALMVTIPRGRKDGFPPEHIMDLGIVLIISGILGARINYIIVFRNDFSWRLFNIGEGIDLLGTLLGGIVVLALYFFMTARMKRREAGLEEAESPSPGVRPVKAGPSPDKKQPGTQGSSPGDGTPGLSLRQFLMRLAGLVVACIVIGVAVGRIVYVFRNPMLTGRQYSTRLDDWGIFKIWHGGIIFYGGLIAAFACGAYYAHRKRFGIMKISDLAIPAVLLALAFGRIGCFLNGCCFGKPTNSEVAICFPRVLDSAQIPVGAPAFVHQYENGMVSRGDTRSLAVVPIQLVEGLACVAFFLILSYIWRHKMRKVPELRVQGLVVAYAGLFYSAGRFVFEFWRGDNEVFAATNLTFSQHVSIAIFIVSFLMMCFLQHKKIVTKRETMRRWREQGLIK
ncbi:MAG: prolipoprotein diacylglyceryl transferase [Planctomycetota bacterium]|nr:prolipoprotein diacylglyceryl transferase [Planctomycetota bacterium]